MGMFDPMTPFADHFKEGEPFTLLEIKHGPKISTEFGESSPALLKIAGANGSAEWYSIFGEGISNQIDRMEKGDLPAEVKLDRVPTRGGQQVKLLVPVE